MRTKCTLSVLQTCLPGIVFAIFANDTCSCLYPNHQEYNEKEEKCTTLINGPCEKKSLNVSVIKVIMGLRTFKNLINKYKIYREYWNISQTVIGTLM